MEETGKIPFPTLELTLKKNVEPKCIVCGQAPCMVFVIDDDYIKFFCSVPCQLENEQKFDEAVTITVVEKKRVWLLSGIILMLLLGLYFVRS